MVRGQAYSEAWKAATAEGTVVVDCQEEGCRDSEEVVAGSAEAAQLAESLEATVEVMAAVA